MKNYRESDYAVNKYSENIVYRFADQIKEVTLEEYLKENPHKTKQDFLELKTLSDEIYLETDRKENAQNKRNRSLQSISETEIPVTVSLEQAYHERQDKQHISDSLMELLHGNSLTDIQKNRFINHFLHNISIRQIAAREGVHHSSVEESIHAALKKLKHIFENF